MCGRQSRETKRQIKSSVKIFKLLDQAVPEAGEVTSKLLVASHIVGSHAIVVIQKIVANMVNDHGAHGNQFQNKSCHSSYDLSADFFFGNSPFGW